MPVITPFIPTSITVHLGKPDEAAENITVPFIDYIKNVTAGEIYPTWPENAIRANVYAIISFALNRYFTEWYPSRNKSFDITSLTAFDQSFAKNRETFLNTDKIVDEIFNSYVAKKGNVQPFFTQFCNGTTSKCKGLSQWGTVDLANKGLSPLEILKTYYGNDINIINNVPVQFAKESYPGIPLKIGDAGNDVKIIQQQLNRIRKNFPAIPYIDISIGIFDVQTENAVKTFQKIFNLSQTGTVDKNTWYSIKRYYTGVKRLGELESEGISFDEASLLYKTELQKGDSGYTVATLQYYLNVIAYFNSNLNLFKISEIFDAPTENAVKVFQTQYGLEPNGIVDRTVWNAVTELYLSAVQNLPDEYFGKYAKVYPGYFLTFGMNNSDVKDLQTYLSAIAKATGKIPDVKIDGIFSVQTRDAVYTFQNLNGLPITGSVGPLTWDRIASAYNAVINSSLVP